MRHPQGSLFGAAGLLTATLVLGWPGGGAWAAGHAGGNGASDHPPGNNGTVKIDGYTMDAGQDNDPHVACGFSVSFFGYDGGPQSASISITPVAPTSGGKSYGTSTSWNVGTRTSGNQFDANVPISGSDLAPALAGVTPQAQQGYHLRLEVEVTGSQGSDDKYKVFWMAPCTPPPTSPGGSVPTTSPTTAPTTTTPTTAPATTVPTTTVSTLGGGETATRAATTTTTVGSALVAAASNRVPSATAAGALGLGGDIPAASAARAVPVRGTGSGLAFTGADLAGLSAVGLGLIGAGTLLTVRWRRGGRRPAQQA